ncbi:hypothetical protein [Nocardia sp. NPDC020380]|uniref:hypothetical protein n=1 Tax=Nocardia sp. NPDC020380 TaxID=3364309 RepID=UPI0037AFB103
MRRRRGMKWSGRFAALPVGCLILGALLTGPASAASGHPARADAGTLAEIDCGATRTDGSRLEISCYNPDSEPGSVDVTYVCSTPLDGRQVVFTEPGNPIGAGATLRLSRDCGPGQVVLTYQVWPLTASQRGDQEARQERIRRQRDQEAGR